MGAFANYLKLLWRQGVIQVALVYVAVAVGLFEAAGAIKARWGLPEWVDHIGLAVLVAGFLPVIFLAWNLRGGAAEIGPPETRNRSNTGKAPTVAVLPFANLSKEEDDEIFADGLLEDLITILSMNSSLVVISRSSSFAYKGQSPDIREVGRDLGARFVLEGSVRRGGDRLRITAQLIDSTTGAHLWAEQYDRPLADLFHVQDDLVCGIAAALDAEVDRAELARLRQETHSISAWEEAVRSSWLHERPSLAQLPLAMAHARKAIALDPEYALAYARLGLAHATAHQMLGEPKDGENGRIAYENIHKALALSPGDPRILGIACSSLSHIGYSDEALPLGLRALKLNPHEATIYGSVGNAYLRSKNSEKALQYYAVEERLAPKSIWLNPRYLYRGIAHLQLRQPEKAVAAFTRAVTGDPSFEQGWLALAAAEVLNGDLPAGAAAVKKLRALNDKLPMEAWARPLAAGIEAPIGEETAAAFRTAWAVADAGA
ncbi:MAG: tetratricopeptide repeat protein [Caulobacteraceae bacterium]